MSMLISYVCVYVCVCVYSCMYIYSRTGQLTSTRKIITFNWTEKISEEQWYRSIWKWKWISTGFEKKRAENKIESYHANNVDSRSRNIHLEIVN